MVNSISNYYELLKGLNMIVSEYLPESVMDCQVSSVTYNSKTAKAGSLFICKGRNFKAQYLQDAIDLGACVYVSEEEYIKDFPHIIVKDIREASIPITDTFYDAPYKKLECIGVTGTKGKSSVVYFLRYILDSWLEAQGKKDCAFLSSIEDYDGVTLEEAHLTTPEINELYQFIATAAENDISHMVVEVSSQALKYGRLGNIQFNLGVFTNLSEDHISAVEHPTLEDYIEAKKKMFERCRAVALYSGFDYYDEIRAYGETLSRIITYGFKDGDDIRCTDHYSKGGLQYFTVKTKNGEAEYNIRLAGLFSVENALAAIAIATELGVPEENIREGLHNTYVPGRMEIYESRDKNVVALVDYAHNGLSFNALLDYADGAFPDYTKIMVFGCPGGKAFIRRSTLGTISNRADMVYITEEDSGAEDFEKIAQEIASYVHVPHFINESREYCIHHAVEDNSGKLLLLITGKGAETDMKRKNGYEPVKSDSQIAQEVVAAYDERN